MHVKRAIKYNIRRAYSDKTIKCLKVQVDAPTTTAIWDQGAVEAVADWQDGQDLDPDGKVGPTSYKAIMASHDAVPTNPSVDRGAFSKARAYNERQGRTSFLCPILQRVIDPRSDEGVEWVRHQQEALGLDNDGGLGPTTLGRLMQRYGPMSLERRLLHPMPLLVWRWGYDHAHDWERPKWPYSSDVEGWTELTNSGSWPDGIIRLVSGYDPRTGTVSRPSRSYITLDLYSVSFSHWWSGNFGVVMAQMSRREPELIAEAFGRDRQQRLLDPNWIGATVGKKRGKAGRKAHRSEHNWLCAGWWWLGTQPAIYELSRELWLADYVPSAQRIIKSVGWERAYDSTNDETAGIMLAACTRLANSGSGMARRVIRGLRKKHGVTDPMRLLKLVYNTPKKAGGYGHPERWPKLKTWPEFKQRYALAA